MRSASNGPSRRLSRQTAVRNPTMSTPRVLARGKSWGEGGPKTVVKQILDSLDRDTVLAQAKQEIRARIGLA